jgi:CRP/FNR family transcriptional regulator
MPISTEQLTAAFPGLDGVEGRVVSQIARASSVRAYSAGMPLFHAGERADALYLVLSGKVLVVRETGMRSQMLHSESAGGVLGEIPVFGNVPFPATATALEATRCARIPIDVIQRLLEAEPSFARFALRRMAARAQSLLRRIDELTATTVVARLAAYVAERAGQSDSKSFSLGVSQARLASEFGTVREVIVRGLSTLVEAGAIERAGRSRFVVRRMATLQSIAGRPLAH